MIDLKIDEETHDIVVKNFTFETTTDIQMDITQRLKVKFLWFRDEWVHNINYGIDWFNDVFEKGIDLNDIDTLFKAEITREQGVEELVSYESYFDRKTRKLAIKAIIKTSNDSLVNVIFDI